MKRFVRFLFFLYLLLLTKMILLKYLSPETALERIASFDWQSLETRLVFAINFVPFRTIAGYLSGAPNLRIGLENVLGNLIGFIPFGFLLPISFRKISKGWRLFIAAFFTSFAFETAQLLFGLGSFDVDDLLLNVSGAMLGFAAFHIFLGSFMTKVQFTAGRAGVR